MNGFRRTLIGASLLAATAGLQAQTETCQVGDARCYQRQYENACGQSDSTVRSCSAWIRSVEPRSKQGDRSAQVMQGHAYMAIANHLSTEADEQARSRASGLALFRQLVASDPSDAEATLALASFTSDPAERLQRLRQVVNLRPAGFIAAEALANELQRLGGTANLLEAAAAIERAAAAQPEPHKWRLAGRAISLYEEAGDSDHARQLRQDIRQQFGAQAMVDELSQASTRTPERTLQLVEKLCDPGAARAVGADGCLQALEVVVPSLAGMPNRDDAQRVADRVAKVMLDMSQEGELALYEADPNWRTRFERWTERMVSQGMESVTVLSASASIQLDKTKKLAALERATQLDPGNLSVAVTLGIEYMLQQRWDDAIRQFRAAKALPDARSKSAEAQQMLDQYIKQAEKGRDATRAANRR